MCGRSACTVRRGERPGNRLFLPLLGSQSPGQSARTILSGVAKNERLVFGDEVDASGSRSCFNPDAATAVDDYLLNVARKRRSGDWAV